MEDKTIEIRWHGRGGQGAVTSAELLALAAIEKGNYAQAMPSFGPERRGAPVLAYNRINAAHPIRTRAPVLKPNIVVVLEPGLLDIIDVTHGLQSRGYIVINSNKSINDLKSYFDGKWTLATVDATSIAKLNLGVPIVNTTMLGALIKATNLISIESLRDPLQERFGAKARNNFEACRQAFEKTVITETIPSKEKVRVGSYSDQLISWKEILPGAVITNIGNARQYRTGDWRAANPIYDLDKCNKCGLCFLYCPEGCIQPKDDGYFDANLYYCKGCGICAKECPRKAITMIEV